jgi:cytochrome bd-type quinol oxidase subunit 2
MLPRPARPHDQLLRSIVVAAVGGLVIGHILWLVAISFAIATTSVNRWVLVVSAVFAVLSVAAVVLGWRFHRRKSDGWAAFLWFLPISPIVFTLCILGATYV